MISLSVEGQTFIKFFVIEKRNIGCHKTLQRFSGKLRGTKSNKRLQDPNKRTCGKASFECDTQLDFRFAHPNKALLKMFTKTKYQ